eukprot:gnl/TRDRNA2_/TRDRNA2_173143_c1_seq8.p2 gnl/TRDRNA2_/TRDRNA2_173143_c1~~gnl/TRDRNA2_/TRDRNA2_173143_c1_seq8.p2  ORF type:complete len:126 (-),score=13.04 gnl/TRDRNA2_/TRDRNA2_173143_c1_seq8:9-386(-)
MLPRSVGTWILMLLGRRSCNRDLDPLGLDASEFRVGDTPLSEDPARFGRSCCCCCKSLGDGSRELEADGTSKHLELEECAGWLGDGCTCRPGLLPMETSALPVLRRRGTRRDLPCNVSTMRLGLH